MKAPLLLEVKTRPSLGQFHETLARIRGWSQPIRSVGGALADSGSAGFVVLRHNVRRNLKSALTMAQWEAAAGVHGTFFLRPVGSQGEDSNYYGRILDGRIEPSQQMLADARAIAAFGHEIGLLGPLDAIAARLGVTAASLVKQQLAMLRESGIEISCIADALPGLTAQVAGVARAAEDLPVDATWGEAEIASPAAALSVPARLVLCFECDAWSRVGSNSRNEESLTSEGAMTRIAAPTPVPGVVPLAAPDPELPPLLVGPREQRISVAIRGDEVGRRMLIALGERAAAKGINLWTSEATSCRSLAESIEGRHPDAELAGALVRIDAMPVLLRDAFLAQFSRAMLDATGLDLLVIDTQVEYDRTYWRHRDEGWTIWFPSRFVHEIEKLESLFEVAPVPDAGSLARSILALLRSLRLENPGLPAVVLCVKSGSRRTPADPVGQMRQTFADAGETGIYVLPVPIDEAPAGGADDRGLELMRTAWSAGLHRHFPHDIDPPAAPVPQAMPATTVAASAPVVDRGAAFGVPLVHISFLPDTPTCTTGCIRLVQATATTVAAYFLSPADAHNAQREYTPMLLPMVDAWDFNAWESAVKPLSGGNRLREKRKAIERGYFVKPFEFEQYIPDIHEINHSKHLRSGGPMEGTYLRSVEEMGGAPQKPIPVRMPVCPHHWGLMFGVFRQAPGRMQGKVVVDDQLVGYISMRRAGEVAIYLRILGHGDYLHDSVMVLLHHETIRWLSTERERYAAGLEFVMYGGAESGRESLLQWKRRAGFRPIRVVATDAQPVIAT